MTNRCNDCHIRPTAPTRWRCNDCQTRHQQKADDDRDRHARIVDTARRAERNRLQETDR